MIVNGQSVSLAIIRGLEKQMPGWRVTPKGRRLLDLHDMTFNIGDLERYLHKHPPVDDEIDAVDLSKNPRLSHDRGGLVTVLRLWLPDSVKALMLDDTVILHGKIKEVLGKRLNGGRNESHTKSSN